VAAATQAATLVLVHGRVSRQLPGRPGC
jgi:hypothetical protein